MIGGGTQEWLFLGGLFYFYCISRRTGNDVLQSCSRIWNREPIYYLFWGDGGVQRLPYRSLK